MKVLCVSWSILQCHSIHYVLRICILNEHREHEFLVIVPHNDNLFRIAGVGACWCNRFRSKCILWCLSRSLLKFYFPFVRFLVHFFLPLSSSQHPCGSNSVYACVHTLHILLMLLKLFFHALLNDITFFVVIQYDVTWNENHFLCLAHYSIPHNSRERQIIEMVKNIED